jgi:DNA (cytosine-5)-methyltransferase 1
VKPRLLDLFCGAGGCSVGYARAGFDVVGVDIEPHPDYPYRLVITDAMEILSDRVFLSKFDVIHASPPCPRYSSITPDANRDSHPDLVPVVRRILNEFGRPYAIENVPGAPMPEAVLVCGKAMGLAHIKRHRLFESNLLLMSPGCACDNGPAYGIYGDHGDKTPRQRKDGFKRWGKARDADHARQITGIDWMTRWDDLCDAIPPAYTEFIGGQLIDALRSAA